MKPVIERKTTKKKYTSNLFDSMMLISIGLPQKNENPWKLNAIHSNKIKNIDDFNFI